ncbi:unnamed protein product [Camellia sinensis]
MKEAAIESFDNRGEGRGGSGSFDNATTNTSSDTTTTTTYTTTSSNSTTTTYTTIDTPASTYTTTTTYAPHQYPYHHRRHYQYLLQHHHQRLLQHHHHQYRRHHLYHHQHLPYSTTTTTTTTNTPATTNASSNTTTTTYAEGGEGEGALITEGREGGQMRRGREGGGEGREGGKGGRGGEGRKAGGEGTGREGWPAGREGGGRANRERGGRASRERGGRVGRPAGRGEGGLTGRGEGRPVRRGEGGWAGRGREGGLASPEGGGRVGREGGGRAIHLGSYSQLFKTKNINDTNCTEVLLKAFYIAASSTIAHTTSRVTFRGVHYDLQPWSISILPNCKNVVFNTAKVGETFSEDISSADEDSKITVVGLLEQLNVTRDTSDYPWYMTSVEISPSESFLHSGQHLTLTVQSTSDALHVFTDGQLSGSAFGTRENRKFVFTANANLHAGTNKTIPLALFSSVFSYLSFSVSDSEDSYKRRHGLSKSCDGVPAIQGLHCEIDEVTLAIPNSTEYVAPEMPDHDEYTWVADVIEEGDSDPAMVAVRGIWVMNMKIQERVFFSLQQIDLIHLVQNHLIQYTINGETFSSIMPLESVTPFGQRKSKFVVQSTLNDLPNVENVKKEHDHEISEDDIIKRVQPSSRNRIRKHATALVASGLFEEAIDPTVASQKSVFAVGMICCEEEGRLKEKPVLLQSSCPFTTTDNLFFEPLTELLAYAQRKQPQLLLLLGPFIDSEHPEIKKGAVNRTFDEIFRLEILGRLQDYVEYMGSAARVILVPSIRDANHDFVFPQPAFDIQQAVSNISLASHNFKEITLSYQITSLTNPGIFSANEIKVGCCTVDILKQLSGEEISRNPSGGSKQRMNRLANHLLSQHSFYPLYPPMEDTRVDFSLASEALQIPCNLHILILSSDLDHFVKVLSIGDKNDGEEQAKCICVNPGRLARGEGAGFFVELNYGGSPDSASASVISI